jgi:signal transduction histidine kinase
VTARLLLGYLGVTLFVLVALEVPLGVQNQRTERRTLEVRLEHDATTLASVAEDAVQSGSQAQLVPIAPYASSYAHSSGARVVIVDARGSALIDTENRVQGAESFASRPEIVAALAGRVASGTRYSRTLGASLLYVAVPIASGGKVHGAVRLTFPTSAVDSRITRYWLMLAAIAAVVLAGAALIGVGLARFVARPLRGLERAAAAVGEGELDTLAPESDGPPEVRSLARAFNQTVAKLSQVLRAQEEFVADASHELRTPLTALRLRLENGDAEGALAEVERLDERVEGLLALARAERKDARALDVDVAAVARERVEHWRPLADEQRVQLVADANGPVAAFAGPERLVQVLDNLLSNALEVAPPSTSVTVSARAVGEWVELRVADQGPGMTAEQRARAFDRFWRASPGGSGLGLAIVRRLVDADGGEVELAEAPGGGLEAIVRLRATNVRFAI